MDRTSTLVLEGKADSFPMLHVNDSATLDGTWSLRISLSPSNLPPPGVWQNFTIMTWSGQCHGSFKNVVVSHAGSCGSIEDVGEVYVRESFVSVAISCSQRNQSVCRLPLSRPLFWAAF